MESNTAKPLAPQTHWHTAAVAMHRGAVETLHTTLLESLATTRRLAVEARPRGRVASR